MLSDFFFFINDFLWNLAGWLEFTAPRFAFLYPPVLFEASGLFRGVFNIAR